MLEDVRNWGSNTINNIADFFTGFRRTVDAIENMPENVEAKIYDAFAALQENTRIALEEASKVNLEMVEKVETFLQEKTLLEAEMLQLNAEILKLENDICMVKGENDAIQLAYTKQQDINNMLISENFNLKTEIGHQTSMHMQSLVAYENLKSTTAIMGASIIFALIIGISLGVLISKKGINTTRCLFKYSKKGENK